MTNPVGIVGPNQNAPPQTQAATGANAPAAPKADFKQQVTAIQQSIQSSVLAHDSDSPISPRIVVDPLAGPIIQVLTTSGEVQSQIPSATVVAYLRAGLTSSGFPKPTADETQTEKGAKENKSIVA